MIARVVRAAPGHAPSLTIVFDRDAPGDDYALRWPRATFVAEARALLAGYSPTDADQAEVFTLAAYLLARQAFVGNVPAADLGRGQVPGWWQFDAARLLRNLAASNSSPRRYLEFLVEVADRLPEQPPRIYWHARQNPGARLQHDWAVLVDQMRHEGFLDRAAPTRCPLEDFATSQDYRLNELTTCRLGEPALDPGTQQPSWWPLRPGTWDEPTFYALVEIVHDLVARPRQLHPHDTSSFNGAGLDAPDCEGHYGDFATDAGRAVYRWCVDHVLAQHHAPVRFGDAVAGDTTRLVMVTGDDRDELIRRALASPGPADNDAVRHAVALFRARAATREDKRSAAVALARVLEDRRKVLKAELLRKDEGALFQIANEFDLRHRDAKQRPDYDEAYLDWVFWWYLATIELTDRLLARQP